jgi:hypothetical protein
MVLHIFHQNFFVVPQKSKLRSICFSQKFSIESQCRIVLSGFKIKQKKLQKREICMLNEKSCKTSENNFFGIHM